MKFQILFRLYLALHDIYVQVILEASRLASIVNGVLRKTVKDIELNGMFQQTLI